MTRRALVLSGGGAKGSFQIGAMEELIFNRGLDFEILCGVSVGALNASFLAQALFDPIHPCLLYTSPSPRDLSTSRMPSSA